MEDNSISTFSNIGMKGIVIQQTFTKQNTPLFSLSGYLSWETQECALMDMDDR